MRVMIAIALVLAACAGAIVQQQLIPQTHAAVTQRWEYLEIRGIAWTDSVKAKETLDKAGREGWELVSVSGHGEASKFEDHLAMAFFKRPAP
jgi:hypothetical protein